MKTQSFNHGAIAQLAIQNISAGIADGEISITPTEGRENTADQLDLELSDHDGLLELPREEAEIELSMGWVGQLLMDKGSFVED